MSKYINVDKIEWHTLYFNGGKQEIAYKDEVDALPTADVAPVVHARWVPHLRKEFFYGHGPEFEFVDDGYNCSKCRYHETLRTNYCSNCGARMDKEVKKNDI